MEILQKYMKWAVPAIMLLVGIYLTPIQIFDDNFSKIPGDMGDARFNNYILEHGHKYLTGQLDKYWDAPFMYPEKQSITFSDNLLGALPIYSVFRGFNYDRETAFQLWILVLFVLNFCCCFYVLLKWFKESILASVGAYIFAFSMLLVGNIYNIQTLPRFIFPFVVYWFWKFLKDKEPKYFLATVIALVYQFYCAVYLGFLSFYVLLFLTLAFITVNYKSFSKKELLNKKFLLTVLGALVIGGLLLAPLMLPYYHHSKIYGLRAYKEVVDTIPTLRSYFFTDHSVVLWSALAEHGKTITLWWCHFLFLGIIPWIAIVLSPIILFSKKVSVENKKRLKTVLLALFLCLLFGTKFNDWSLYKLIYQLPGFSSMRSINRLINTEVLLFIIIIVLFFKEVKHRFKYGSILVCFLPFFVIADNLIDANQLMRFEKQAAQNRVELVKQNINDQATSKEKPIAYTLLSEANSNKIYGHIDVMLGAQELNVVCVNAYTGSYPDKFWEFFANTDSKSLNNWLQKHSISSDSVQMISDLGIPIKSIVKTNIKVGDFFLCTEWDRFVKANKKEASLWEEFRLVETELGYLIVSYDNKLLSIEDGFLVAKANNIEQASIFKLDGINSSAMNISLNDSLFLVAETSSQKITVRNLPQPFLFQPEL